MKIIDIRDKKVVYEKNLGDNYYWEYKLIVKVDDNNYCLINYNNSYSGYISFSMECVDEEFISAFMQSYDGDFIKFDKCNKCLRDFFDDEYLYKTLDVDVVLILKEKIQKYLDILEGEDNEC